jgi:aminopeptidase N
MYGHDDYLKYTNAYKKKVQNNTPIITQHGVNAEPPQDMYFKGALFLNTLRSIINDDQKWFALIRDVFQHFKYQNIMTEDMAAYMNQKTGLDLTPVFDQYLRHVAIPKLELKFDEAAGTFSYRWKADVANFAMSVKVGTPAKWTLIYPTTEWKTDKTDIKPTDFAVATDLYYVDVAR